MDGGVTYRTNMSPVALAGGVHENVSVLFTALLVCVTAELGMPLHST